MTQPLVLTTVSIKPAKPEINAEWVRRHGVYPKGTVLKETRVLSCPRRKVSEFPPGFLKQNHIEALEQNQKLAHCCRHPENHWVEGYKTHPDELVTDSYEYICTCGRRHRVLCVGIDDTRPEWK